MLTTPPSSPEHVLRGSKSFAARSFRSRAPVSGIRFAPPRTNDENVAASAGYTNEPAPVIASSRPPVLGELANNQVLRPPGPWKLRPSPTPSIRKKKIEELVTNHGSPTHVRVTAGGRIVPSEQSPLCHPRFGYSAIKTNGGLIKVAANHAGKPQQWTSATQDGYIAQDGEGRLCQIVNGAIMPLCEEDGALRLYMPAPNLNISQRGVSAGTPNAAFNQPNIAMPEPTAPANVLPYPTVSAQKNALELEYSKLEHELRELDKTEVLHGRTMGKAAKDALFSKRRELVTSMDKVRKALKSLNDLPQAAQIPTSPKAMRERQATSPRVNRLPLFLQRYRQGNSVSAPPPQVPMPNFGHPFFEPGAAQGAFGYPPMHSSEASLTGIPYQMPPPGAFMQPPPFDGSMGAPFPIYQDPVQVPVPAGPPAVPQPASTQLSDGRLPQHDGSKSSEDIKAASPPRQSHVLPIKDPETKQVTNVKSLLNPMSPVYKPARGYTAATANEQHGAFKPPVETMPTPLSLMHGSKPIAKASPPEIAADSSSKKKTVVDGSSISSIKTADFFPRNTREYSTRKHEYPVPSDESGDKENIDPEKHELARSPMTPKHDRHNTNWNPEIPDGAFAYASPQMDRYAAPSVPPGTPVFSAAIGGHDKPVLNLSNISQHQSKFAHDAAQVPDREMHNLSPKSKRTWQFVEEHPSHYTSEDAYSSSPAKDHQCREELCATASPFDTIDLSNKSRDWVEGYQAGLHRNPVGADRMGDFLDGYCSGLLKSQPVTSVSLGISDGSPSKAIRRRSTPVPPPVPTSSAEPRPPLEATMQSMDTLKQAILAPQNENAVLTPGLEAPHVNDAPFHLGAWQKRQANLARGGDGFPFPQRNSSLNDRHAPSNEQSHDYANPPQQLATRDQNEQHPPSAAGKGFAPNRVSSGPRLPPSNRISSITSIDSAMLRPWPSNTGPRVLSPAEWKSTSSVAQAASLATGYFSPPSQFDGTNADVPLEPSLTQAAGSRPAGSSAWGQGKQFSSFREEASLDGMSSPASPGPGSPVMSPVSSPRVTPSKVRKEKKESPAKAKFEHIASKVGIKVAERKDGHVSPPGNKKKWRDMWRRAEGEGAS